MLETTVHFLGNDKRVPPYCCLANSQLSIFGEDCTRGKEHVELLNLDFLSSGIKLCGMRRKTAEVRGRSSVGGPGHSDLRFLDEPQIRRHVVTVLFFC